MRSHGVLVLMVLFGCCSAGYRNFGRTTTDDGLNAAIDIYKDIQERGNGQQTGQNGNEQPIDSNGIFHQNPIDPFGNYQPKETDGNTRLNPIDPYDNSHQIDPYDNIQHSYVNGQRIDNGNNHQIDQYDNRQDTYGVNQQIDRYGNRLQIDRYGNVLQIDRHGNRQLIDSQGTIRMVDQYGNRQLIDPQGTIKIIDQYGNRQQIDPNGGIQIIDQYGNRQRITPPGNTQQGFPNGNRHPTDPNGNSQPISPKGNHRQINPNGNSFQNPSNYNGNGQQIDSNGNNEQIESNGNNQQINPNRNNQQRNPNGNGQSMNSYGNNQQVDSNGDNQQINPNGNPSPTDYNGNYQTESDLCFNTEKQEWGRCVKTTLCRLQPPKYDPATGFIYKMGSMFGYDDDDQSQRDQQCNFLQMCCPLNKIKPTPVKPSVRPMPGCGYSNPGGAVFGAIFREKGGSTPPNNGYADFAEFPWMVALLKSQATGFTGGGYTGGGTLIHPSVVMTAAHKVDTLTPSEVKCRAGEWNTLNENEAFEHQERNVKSIAVHEQFDRLYSRFDIALLFTSSPFSIEAHVNVACLSRALPPPGTGCYSMGWGEDLIKGTNYAVLLKKISLPLVSREACERQGKRKLGETYSLHRTLTCAVGTELLDTCIGDGGSPLVCPIGDPSDLRYGVVGMVAYEFAQCGEAGVPGVYVNVPQLYTWLDSQMEMEGISDRPYIVA